MRPAKPIMLQSRLRSQPRSRVWSHQRSHKTAATIETLPMFIPECDFALYAAAQDAFHTVSFEGQFPNNQEVDGDTQAKHVRSVSGTRASDHFWRHVAWGS